MHVQSYAYRHTHIRTHTHTHMHSHCDGADRIQTGWLFYPVFAALPSFNMSGVFTLCCGHQVLLVLMLTVPGLAVLFTFLLPPGIPPSRGR